MTSESAQAIVSNRARMAQAMAADHERTEESVQSATTHLDYLSKSLTVGQPCLFSDYAQDAAAAVERAERLIL